MYKMNRSYSKAQTFAEAEKNKLFLKTDSLSERLRQAWYLTAMAYGIDPENPPRMEKRLTAIRKKNNDVEYF